jgi:HK97 gp10 family phage protein
MSVEYKVTGMEELTAKLKTVGTDMQRKGGRYALRKAAQVLRDQARMNAARVDDPKTPEDIAKNVVERWDSRTFNKTGNLGFRVGVLGGARGYAKASGEVKGKGKANPGGDTFYWRFLEFGTSHMAARPFIRSAMNRGQEAVGKFINEYGKALDRALRRAGRGGR